jgi:hypothetical protein
MRARASAIGLWLVTLASCGSDDGQTFACQFGADASRYCIETTTSFKGGPDCGEGTLVATCTRTGTDGGCVHTFASGGASLRQTIWYYSGSATQISSEMSDCEDLGGTWVQP